MAIWERERVRAMAPDRASLSAAQQLAVASRWSSTGATARAVWGRCQGSGRQPYQTVVDVSVEHRSTCSCPSRKSPCKHVLGLLLLWSAGGVREVDAEADFAAEWLAGRDRAPQTTPTTASGEVADPGAAAKRAEARVERVEAGLDDLELWLHDQVTSGLSGLQRAGYASFDQIAARMVDAQAPGVASMLRAVPAELAGDGWPERVLERLGALQLLIAAHRNRSRLSATTAADVRSRVGYPVARQQVLSTPGVADRWQALGSVDTVEYQLETRRVWLHGSRTRRWALWLAFAAPGMSLDLSVRAGQVFDGMLHFYPGSGFRALVGRQEELPSSPGPVAPETLGQVNRRFAELLAVDPWAVRLPAVVAAAPLPPERPGQPWRLRDADGHWVELAGLDGDPWPLLARSAGELLALFGEWSPRSFRPLGLLADSAGSSFSTVLV